VTSQKKAYLRPGEICTATFGSSSDINALQAPPPRAHKVYLRRIAKQIPSASNVAWSRMATSVSGFNAGRVRDIAARSSAAAANL
jgi:hypothetical protein